MFSLSKAEAANALDISEWALLIFGTILVIGIIGEYKHIPKWLGGEKHKLFEALVMIAVAGELMGDGGVFVFSRQLQSMGDYEIAQLKADEASSKADATKFESQIAEAKAHEKASDEKVAAAGARAKEAEAKAESSRLEIAKAQESAAKAIAEAAKANLELAKLKTARTVSKEAQDRITAKLKAFIGIPYDIWCNTDSDSTALMNLIDDAIVSAKWQRKKPPAISIGNKAGITSETGVSVHVAQEESEGPLGRAAIAFRDAFIAEGIPAIAYGDPPEITTYGGDRTILHVIIGSKPLN